MAGMRSLDDIAEEYEFLEGDERYRLLIELGRDLEPMPDALKTVGQLRHVRARPCRNAPCGRRCTGLCQ